MCNLFLCEALALITPKNPPMIETPKNLQNGTVIAFTTGCS